MISGRIVNKSALHLAFLVASTNEQKSILCLALRHEIERLQSRDYSVQKVEENVECELIGLITAECLDLPHLELDSADSMESMIAAVESWITDGFKPQKPSEPIDWIDEIHGED